MDSLREMLAVSEANAYKFFKERISEVVIGRVTEHELMHVASFMAHFASSSQIGKLPAPSGLEEFFQIFVLDRSETRDAKVMELAGSQALFLAGFFGEQRVSSHNLSWYLRLSSDYYSKASDMTPPQRVKKRTVLKRMSKSVPQWALILLNLNRSFRENQYDPRLVRVN